MPATSANPSVEHSSSPGAHMLNLVTRMARSWWFGWLSSDGLTKRCQRQKLFSVPSADSSTRS